MKEKIASYNSELNNIKLVVDKLTTKQNAQVFDKVCVMCSELFDKIASYNSEELNVNTIRDLVDILKRLLDICITLKNYKDYLVGVINQNIAELQGTQAKMEPQQLPKEEVVTEVREVQADELSAPQVLQLTYQEKNAA